VNIPRADRQHATGETNDIDGRCLGPEAAVAELTGHAVSPTLDPATAGQGTGMG